MVSGSNEGLSEYLLARVDDDQLARFIPNLDKIIADLKLEFDQSKIAELAT